jgi:hypothetical protein
MGKKPTRRPDPKRIVLRIGISAQTLEDKAVQKAASVLIDAIARSPRPAKQGARRR